MLLAINRHLRRTQGRLRDWLCSRSGHRCVTQGNQGSTEGRRPSCAGPAEVPRRRPRPRKRQARSSSTPHQSDPPLEPTVCEPRRIAQAACADCALSRRFAGAAPLGERLSNRNRPGRALARQEHPDLVAKNNFSGIDSQKSNPAVKAMARFPDVLRKMSQNLFATRAELGDAMVRPAGRMSPASSRNNVRERKSSSTLKSNAQQTVTRVGSSAPPSGGGGGGRRGSPLRAPRASRVPSSRPTPLSSMFPPMIPTPM